MRPWAALLLAVLLGACSLGNSGSGLDPDAPAVPAVTTEPVTPDTVTTEPVTTDTAATDTAATDTAATDTAATDTAATDTAASDTAAADLPATEPTLAPEPAPSPVLPTPSAPPAEPTVIGTFPVERAPEVSGIAASGLDPDRIWLLDDGPGTTSLLVVDRGGGVLGEVTMAGVEGRDTEALAVAPCGPDDPSPCVYVGDIGDNTGSHSSIRVHRFPEPAEVADMTVEVDTVALTHPDGPVNAEAMLIDAGAPVILTRQADITVLHAAPTFADASMVELARLDIPPPSSPLLTLFTGLVVTDAARHPVDGRVLLRTYDHVVELTPPAPAAPLATIAEWPARELPVATEAQGEAITWLSADGGWGHLTASEGSGELSFTPVR